LLNCIQIKIQFGFFFVQIVDNVFGCIDDIYDLTSRFLSDLEDAKEMREDMSKSISLYEPFQNFIEVK